MAKKKVEPTFGSIFRAVEEKASSVSFLQVAPYEYINAPFYIDADAETFAAVLNGEKDFTVAVAQGSITINGDAAQAVVFCSTLF